MAKAGEEPGEWLEEYWHVISQESWRAVKFFDHWLDFGDLWNEGFLVAVDVAGDWRGVGTFASFARMKIRDHFWSMLQLKKRNPIPVEFRVEVNHPGIGGVGTSWPKVRRPYRVSR